MSLAKIYLFDANIGTFISHLVGNTYGLFLEVLPKVETINQGLGLRLLSRLSKQLLENLPTNMILEMRLPLHLLVRH